MARTSCLMKSDWFFITQMLFSASLCLCGENIRYHPRQCAIPTDLESAPTHQKNLCVDGLVGVYAPVSRTKLVMRISGL